MNAKELIRKIAKKEITDMPIDPVHAYYYLMGLIANEALHEDDAMPKLPETFYSEAPKPESPKNEESMINKYDQMKKKREEAKIHLEIPPESTINTTQKKRWEGRRKEYHFETKKAAILQWLMINKSTIIDLVVFLEIEVTPNTKNVLRQFMNKWCNEPDSPIIFERQSNMKKGQPTIYYFAKNFGKRVEINSVLGVRS